MGSREAFDLTRLEDEAELGFGDLAQELLPPLQAVRMGVSLVRRASPEGRAIPVVTDGGQPIRELVCETRFSP